MAVRPWPGGGGRFSLRRMGWGRAGGLVAEPALVCRVPQEGACFRAAAGPAGLALLPLLGSSSGIYSQTPRVRHRKWLFLHVLMHTHHVPRPPFSLNFVSKWRASFHGVIRDPPTPVNTCHSLWSRRLPWQRVHCFFWLLLYSQYYKFVLSFVTCSILGAVVFVLCCVE